jgi:hypothetical protein
MSENESPTYSELAHERQREWAEAQTLAAKGLAELDERLRKMPDVASAPAVGSQWEAPPGVICWCLSRLFRMRRWVTVNGVRHRAEVECENCKTVGTWDWATSQWLT